MKPILDNPYGYKICYQEKGSKFLVEKFYTHSYRRAVAIKNMYLKYPVSNKKHTLFIIPIKKREVMKGIWRQVPF